MRKLDSPNATAFKASADVDDGAYRKILQISICTLLINSGFSRGRWQGREDSIHGKEELGLRDTRAS